MSVLLLTHHSCLAHQNSEDHPESPDRLRAVLSALEAEDFAHLLREVAPPATEAQLCLAHPPDYVAQILAIRPQPGRYVPLDSDTAMNHASAEAALHAAGAAVAAVDAVCTDASIRRAFCATRPPGHHAEPSRAMGFCFFGNAVIAARHAQRAHGLARVAILDFDVHHGNGTQAAVWDDPSILFASSHQSPCYPGTGDVSETGVGNIVNAPLPPGADGAAFRAAWADRLLPAVEAFAPDLLVLSAGFDAHARDPLAQLRVREADFGWLTHEICRIADRLCGGRVVSLLEGGYDLDALATSTAAHVRALMA
ncbi:histone deacetylase family protein [Roseomonas aerophila]|uniref:Histone deacetylase family protein n=1 Tax=Teichococcus aerophilus TaxID=1224513 RepID=A0ABR7RP44_9PROT|nr:histone deacetylase family protein [Pseudoroseomonas aerophila]MBC9208370.1 histone deacetylase family protein [Pseudoroseomonas aerophila]